MRAPTARSRTLLHRVQRPLLVLLAFAAAPPAARSLAAEPSALEVVTGAIRFGDAAGEPGLLAVAATVDSRGAAAGGLLLVHEATRTRATVALLRGTVEEDDAGVRAVLQGVGQLESEARPVLRDAPATLSIRPVGTFELTLGEKVLTGSKRAGGVTFARHETAAGARVAGAHDVGHWLGAFYGSSTDESPTLAFGAVSFDDTPDVEGLPEVVGVFRDSAERTTDALHGHLDFVKPVGDPGKGLPLARSGGFEADGKATCLREDGAEARSELGMTLNLRDGLLEFRAPDCDVEERLPVVVLPCPGSCRRTVILGPGAAP